MGRLDLSHLDSAEGYRRLSIMEEQRVSFGLVRFVESDDAVRIGLESPGAHRAVACSRIERRFEDGACERCRPLRRLVFLRSCLGKLVVDLFHDDVRIVAARRFLGLGARLFAGMYRDLDDLFAYLVSLRRRDFLHVVATWGKLGGRGAVRRRFQPRDEAGARFVGVDAVFGSGEVVEVVSFSEIRERRGFDEPDRSLASVPSEIADALRRVRWIGFDSRDAPFMDFMDIHGRVLGFDIDIVGSFVVSRSHEFIVAVFRRRKLRVEARSDKHLAVGHGDVEKRRILASHDPFDMRGS